MALPLTEPMNSECLSVSGADSISIEYKGGTRCELALFNSTNYCKKLHIEFDVFKLDELDFEIIIMQLHAKRDFFLGENFRRPPLSLKVYKNTLYLDYSYDMNSLSLNDFEFLKNHKRHIITNDFSSIINIKMDLQWSMKSDGFLSLKLNDSVSVSESSINLGYNDLLMPYIKFGVYNFNNYPIEIPYVINYLDMKYECLM